MQYLATSRRAVSLATLAALACTFTLNNAHGVAAERELEPRMAQRLDWPSTDRLIIKYRSGSGADKNESFPTARAQMAAQVAANRQGLTIQHHRRTANGAQVVRLSRQLNMAESMAMAADLRAGDASIEYVEPDSLHHPMLLPNDTLLAQQWSLSDSVGGVRAPAAWDKVNGSGVTIAVLDSGIRPHADLAARLLPGYDFVTELAMAGDGNGRDADASDPGDFTVADQCGAGKAAGNSSWHGTHVAGIAAASGGNGIGISGLAFGSKLLPLRVLGRCGGYSSDIADAIVWASGAAVNGLPTNANPAKVINLSLGGAGACSLTTQNAINTARAKGAVVVVAAGNSNTDASSSSPANCSGVIAVAATGKEGGRAAYSNFGSMVSLAAPGGDKAGAILSTWNAGSTVPGADNYAAMMGTSMAAPVVSGVAALMLSANPNLSPDQVAGLLKSSARAFPLACSNCGAGIVDAAAAVALAIATKTNSPTPAPASAPAPTPAPAPTTLAITDKEPNASIATAQVLASLPALVSGTISSSADNDYFKFTLPAGKKVIATLSAGSAASGFGVGVYMSGGQQLLLSNGVVGAQQRIEISNPGSSPASLVIRVMRGSGAIGSYKLTLNY